MRILFNDHELARRAESDQAAGEVLAELQQEVRAGGKIITAVAIDGQPLPDGRVRRELLSAPVSSLQTMKLTIEEPLNLQGQTLRDAALLAGMLVGRTKPLSRKFRLGDDVAANKDLAAFLEDLKLVLAGVDISTRGIGVRTASTAVRDTIMQFADRLLPTLDRLYKAQAVGDYVAVADGIEYDLCEEIAAWQPLLSEAEQNLNSTARAD